MDYYHVYVEYVLKGEEHQDFWFDMSEEVLKEKIVNPFNEGKSFWFIGRTIHKSMIETIFIFHSNEPARKIVLPNGKTPRDADNRYTCKMFCEVRVEGVVNKTHKFNLILENTLISERKQLRGSPDEKTKVFIVHGRDKAPALTLQKYLINDLKLDAIMFEDYRKKNTSSTIIEMLEYITKNVGYVFIVATPDDVGCLRKTVEKCKNELLGKTSVRVSHLCNNILAKFLKRPRQNVTFEHGLFIGVLGRDRVCCLLHKEVEERPSDIDGILYVPFEESVEDKFTEIDAKLEKLGLIKK